MNLNNVMCPFPLAFLSFSLEESSLERIMEPFIGLSSYEPNLSAHIYL